MKTLACLLSVLTASLSPLASPAAPAAGVPPDQAHCFQVQYLLRLNGLESQHFVQEVAALREMDPDDPATTARIADLGRQSVTLRHDEAVAFSRVSRLLRTMGAPPALRLWSENEQEGLQQPPVMTSDERKTAAAQPDTATVLATLDECVRVEADTDDHMATLGAWLSLTSHAAGLWAADVGELTAVLHLDVAEGTPPHVSASLGRHLASTAPTDTPTVVLNALVLLSPPTGNLGDLAPATDFDIPLPQATQAQDALLTAFSTPTSSAPTRP